jgi:hypothetical protein
MSQSDSTISICKVDASLRDPRHSGAGRTHFGEAHPDRVTLAAGVDGSGGIY